MTISDTDYNVHMPANGTRSISDYVIDLIDFLQGRQRVAEEEAVQDRAPGDTLGDCEK